MLKEITEREKELKEQLNIYTAKYDDFQNSLQKSNDIFATYKVELDRMSKNTRKLEKEAMEWKRKWEKSNATLIELATEKKERDDHAIRCNKQVEQLQKLLRALQNERSHLYKVIKENNVEVPPLPALPSEPEPMKTEPINNVADKDKMDMMTKNCAELKQTLANLQNQMKILNLKGAEAEEQCKMLQAQEESIKKKKNKKSKAKKNAASNGNKESSPALSEDATSVKCEQEQETPIENDASADNTTAEVVVPKEKEVLPANETVVNNAAQVCELTEVGEQPEATANEQVCQAKESVVEIATN